MSDRVISIESSESLHEAVKLMDKNRVSCIVACEGEVPVGIVTGRDLIGLAAAERARDWLELEVACLMSSPLQTLQEDEPLERALELTENNEISHIPITNKAGRLVGMVTQTNLLRHYVERMLPESRTLGTLAFARPNSERRRDPRFDLRALVEFQTERSNGNGILWNVSRSGLRIEMADPPPIPGSVVKVRMAVYPESPVLELRGEVVRETESGFAVRFVDLDPSQWELLQRAFALTSDAPREGG